MKYVLSHKISGIYICVCILKIILYTFNKPIFWVWLSYNMNAKIFRSFSYFQISYALVGRMPEYMKKKKKKPWVFLLYYIIPSICSLQLPWAASLFSIKLGHLSLCSLFLILPWGTLHMTENLKLPCSLLILFNFALVSFCIVL